MLYLSALGTGHDADSRYHIDGLSDCSRSHHCTLSQAQCRGKREFEDDQFGPLIENDKYRSCQRDVEPAFELGVSFSRRSTAQEGKRVHERQSIEMI